jgi:hypothetical protein
MPSPERTAGRREQGAAVEYVMVPVPEDLVEPVLAFIAWKGPPRVERSPEAASDAHLAVEPDAGTDAEGGPIGRTFEVVDRPTRNLLAAIAAASLDQQPLTLPEAAQRAGITTREALGAILQVNMLIAGEGGPAMPVAVTGLEGASATNLAWDSSVVTLQEPVAREVVELAAIGASE